MANNITGKNDSIGPVAPTPKSESSHPHWKTATRTPNAAPIERMLSSSRDQRYHKGSERPWRAEEGQQHHETDEQRKLRGQNVSEVDVDRGRTSYQTVSFEPASARGTTVFRNRSTRLVVALA